MTYNSSHDMLALVLEIMMRRLPMIAGKVIKERTGIIPRGMADAKLFVETMGDAERKGYQTARTLHWRYRAGKYHHTDMELKALAEFCRFLIRAHARTQGTTPRQFSVDEGAMRRKRPLPKGTYTDMSLQQYGLEPDV